MWHRGTLSVIAALAACGALTSARAGTDGERRIGDALSYALPVGVLATEVWRGDREGTLQFGASFVTTVAATEVLKRATHVERPDHSNDQSFPSGHAARAFAAATFVHRRHGAASAMPLYMLATYVGYTRVQSQRHRWGDIAGAAAVSAVSSGWIVTPAGVSIAVAPGGVALHWSVPLQ